MLLPITSKMGNRGLRRSPVRKRLSKKLNDACYWGHVDTVLELVDKVNINKKDEDGETCFTSTIWGLRASTRHFQGGMPHLEEYYNTIAKILIDFGVDTDVKLLIYNEEEGTDTLGVAVDLLSDYHQVFKDEIEEYIWWNRVLGIKG